MKKEKGKIVHQAHKYMTALIASLLAVILLAVLFIIITCILFIRKIHTLYYNEIYKNTYDNIKRLSKNDASLSEYSNTDYIEIKELNDATVELKNRLKNSYLMTKDADYHAIGVSFLDKSRRIVDYEIFSKNIK